MPSSRKYSVKSRKYENIRSNVFIPVHINLRIYNERLLLSTVIIAKGNFAFVFLSVIFVNSVFSSSELLKTHCKP